MSTSLAYKLIGKNRRHWTQKICPLITDSCLLCSLSVLFAEIMLCESWNQYRKMHRAGHTADSHSRALWFQPHSNAVPLLSPAFATEENAYRLSTSCLNMPCGSSMLVLSALLLYSRILILKVTDLKHADTKQLLNPTPFWVFQNGPITTRLRLEAIDFPRNAHHQGEDTIRIEPLGKAKIGESTRLIIYF